MSALQHALLDQIAALEADNASLRDALQNVQDPQKQDQNGDTPYDRLAKKYDELSKQYRALREKHDKCRPYIERASEKYRAAKESARQWQEFYDHQQSKADKLKKKAAAVARASSPVEGVPDSDRTPRAAPSNKRPVLLDARHEDQQPNGSDGADQDASFRPLDEGHGVESRQSRPAQRSQTSDSRAQRVTSSQTTEIGSDPLAPSNVHASSEDEPEFVSARPVKRRRGNSPRTTKPCTQIKQERTSPSQPHEIDSEDYSSPALERRKPVRTETSNLDAIFGTLGSPTSRRERRAVSAELMPPPRMPAATSSLSEGNASDPMHSMMKDEADASETAPDQPAAGRSRELPPEGSDASDRVLQPLSANVARPARRSVSGEMKRKRDSRPKAAILSEDGDMDSSQVDPKQQEQAPKAAISCRLDSLLDEPTPGRNQVAARAMPNTSRLRRSGEFANIQNTTPSRRSPLKKPPADAQLQKVAPEDPKGMIVTKRSPLKRQPLEARPVFKTPSVSLPKPSRIVDKTPSRPQFEGSPPPPEPEEEPLRSRPVIRLDLDDFRINPEWQGTGYAFADTLRGRDQRRCLPGCTRTECCGDAFRKAAEMGVKSKKTDHEALTAYLGPGYESHMNSKSAAERKELLIKARTYVMASEHGKHRQAFKRRTTPPGFWRTDFPTTQETEEDRMKAHELSRQEVYDRWREAMNPGGRWKFRDE